MSAKHDLFRRIDHVQLAIPVGGEDRARAFWTALGLTETPKPPSMAARGGAWFVAGGNNGVAIHVGAEVDFRPARKAHPAIVASSLDILADRLAGLGCPVRWDEEIPDVRRFFCEDPFGNRLEFVEG